MSRTQLNPYLRRCWANHLLVEEGISPCIVMALGGWSSYDAIESYLAAPTEENIIDSTEMATGWPVKVYPER